jgi:acyl-CoA thioesterase
MSPDLPRLRSAQVAFMGPASDELSVVPTLLRRGKSTAFVGVDVEGDGGVATRALLTFAADRQSRIEHAGLTPPTVLPPGSCPDFFEERPNPAFSRHFEMRRAGGDLPFSGSHDPALAIWIRHRDRSVDRSNPASLIVMADASPPAAITMFHAPAPISSVTWSLEMLEPCSSAQATEWVLLQTTGLTASRGYSIQGMFLWDEHGVPLVVGTQCVALFA